MEKLSYFCSNKTTIKQEMSYKHIVFDVDGTLVDNEKAVISTWQETILQLTGRTYEAKKLAFVMGVNSETALKELGLSHADEVFKTWENIYLKHQDEVQLFEDIEFTLRKLQDEGYQLGIVTSRTRYELCNDPTLANLLPCFQQIICVSDTTEPKPSPAPLLAYLKKSNAAANETLYIGDSFNDALCANAANVAFAWAAWSDNDPTIANKAKYILHTPKDLFLQNILNK